MLQIFSLYLGFEDEKNIHVLQVLIWGFGGLRLVLLRKDLIYILDLYLNFEGAKNIQVL